MDEALDLLGVDTDDLEEDYDYMTSDEEDYDDYGDTLSALSSLVSSVALGTESPLEVYETIPMEGSLIEEDDPDYIESDDEDNYDEPEIVIAEAAPATTVTAVTPAQSINVVETSERPEEKKEVLDPERWQSGKRDYSYTPKPKAKVLQSAPTTKIAVIKPVTQKPQVTTGPDPKPTAVKPPSTLEEALVQDVDESDSDFIVRLYYTRMTSAYAGTDVSASVLLGRYFLAKVKNGVKYDEKVEEYLRRINELIKRSAK